MLRRYGLQYLNPDEILPIFWSIFEESKDPYRKIEGALGIGAYHIVEEYLKTIA